MYEKYIKRLLDFFVAFILLIVLSPVLFILCMCTLFSLGTPIIFSQERPGKDGKLFTLYKLRTMDHRSDKPDIDRLKPMGAFFRKLHLDELPELFNILKGDMSFVGPRPQLPKDMLFFSNDIMRRQDVRPGLTGLAQSYGKSALRWDIKFEYDLEYIKRITFLSDARIILRTFSTVFASSNTPVDECGDYGDWLLATGRITNAEYDEKMGTQT